MESLTILWPILLCGIIIFFIAYIKQREKIPTAKRDKFERILMIAIIIFLLIDIGFAIEKRKLQADELNDCIRFYRYFPDFRNDTDFSFIQRCYSSLGNDSINQLKISGREWSIKDITAGNVLLPNLANS
jgi:hypothetical protein